MTIELGEVEGYESLASILKEAYEQAAVGKGRERHGNGLPFDEQPMQTISQLLDSENGMAFQAIKKMQEGIRLPTTDAKVRELLGTIVYTAGIILYLRRKDEGAQVHAVPSNWPSVEEHVQEIQGIRFNTSFGHNFKHMSSSQLKIIERSLAAVIASRSVAKEN